jgi:hypothetical protein
MDRPSPKIAGAARIRPASRSWCLLALLAMVAWGGRENAAWAEPRWAGEYELKAAFVYNLISFVDWPQGALGDRVVVGFAGEGPMNEILTRFFQDKRIGPRPVEVRIVRTRAELRACNVLLLGYPDATRQREALKYVEATSVLTVGDGKEFVQMGGIVAFVARANAFQLAINARAAERAQLQISAKLMKMSELVADESSRGKLP